MLLRIRQSIKSNYSMWLIALSFGIVLTLTEIVMRSYYEIRPLNKITNPICFGFLLSSIILFSRSRIIAILYVVFVSFIYAVQYSNLAYFGYWVSPTDVWLLFEKMTEVTQAGMSVLSYQKTSIVMLAIIFTSLLGLLYMRKKVVDTHRWVSVFGLLILFFYPVKMTIDKGVTLGHLPDNKYTVVKTSFYTMGYFFAHTFPEEVFGLSKVKSILHLQPQLALDKMSDNIIVVMGESLSAEYMSTFGFEQNTMPWLDSQKDLGNSYLGQSFSGGLFTDVSVPFFFNLIEKPNARKQIAMGDTNLFRLAQKQGYKTFFYTSQMSAGLSFVSLLGIQWIDQYINSSAVTKDPNTATDDKQLIAWLKQAPLGERNLIVLNQNGSHEPYIDRSPQNKKVFGQGTLYKEYLNSIHYTDEILKKIHDEVEKLPGIWTLIFTSDHGQHVTKTSAGKGRFEYSSNYLVPVYVTSNDDKVMALTKSRLSQCEINFHVQVSGLVSELMGYQNDYISCQKGFIANSRLTGNSGYMEIQQMLDNGEYTKELRYQ